MAEDDNEWILSGIWRGRGNIFELFMEILGLREKENYTTKMILHNLL